MTTQYLYADHTAPSQYLTHNGMLVQRATAQSDPTTYGLVPHDTEDGDAPLGYSDWTLADGIYSRSRLGTEEERAAAMLEQWRSSAEVSALQGMLAIQAGGMVAGFNAWKATLDPSADFAVIAFFEKAQTWKRDNPHLIQGATALGLTDVQLDGLFTLAATL